MTPLGLIVLASIGLEVQAAEGIATEDLGALTVEVSRAIQRRTHKPVRIVQSDCVKEIGECVLVRVYAAVTTIGVFLVRYGVGEQRVNLTFNRKDWRPPIDGAIEDLFPIALPPVQPKLPPTPSPAVDPSAPVLGYVLISTAGVLGATATALFVSATVSNQRLEDELGMKDSSGHIVGVTYTDAESRLESVNTRRNAAAIVGAVSVATLIAGVIAIIAHDDEPSGNVLDTRGRAAFVRW